MVGDWRDLSVLIVGCGSIGKRHARVLGGLGISSLRACDPVAEQRDSILAQVPEISMYESYQDALADRPDAVLICTPPAQHVPQSIQAIRAGCHVLCEKPLSNTMEGIDTLAALAASEHKKVMVALCFRYHDGLIKAKQYLDSGQIGRLVSIRAMVGEHLPDVRPDYQELDVARTGGAFELVHEIDLAIWYAALPVREVSAFSGNYSDIGIEAPDLTEILIDFEGACLASVHLDLFQQPRRRQLELIGTDGVILVEFASWERCTVSMYRSGSQGWEQEQLVTQRDDMFRAEDREFLRAVAEDRPIACTIAQARKSVEVVLAAQRG